MEDFLFSNTSSCFSHIYHVTKFIDSYNKPWLADGTYPKTGFKKKHRETKTMTFIRKKKIIWFMVLVCFISSIASAEARAYPVAGSNATTFFGSTNLTDEEPTEVTCHNERCCSRNNQGHCDGCCSSHRQRFKTLNHD